MFSTQFNGLPENRPVVILPTLGLYQVGQHFGVWLSGEITANGFGLSIKAKATLELALKLIRGDRLQISYGQPGNTGRGRVNQLFHISVF